MSPINSLTSRQNHERASRANFYPKHNHVLSFTRDTTPPQTLHEHVHELLYECDEGSGRQGIVKVPKSVGMDPPIIAAISEGIPPRVRAKSRSRAIARASFVT